MYNLKHFKAQYNYIIFPFKPSYETLSLLSPEEHNIFCETASSLEISEKLH